MTRRGFTLLETMVALVILGLVVVGFFQMFGVSVRTAKNVETWTEAIWYAEAGMEMAKLDLNATVGRGSEPLEGGYIRGDSTGVESGPACSDCDGVVP
ncbi:MAG: type II secretion system protein [Gemmatimonadales bacterium]